MLWWAIIQKNGFVFSSKTLSLLSVECLPFLANLLHWKEKKTYLCLIEGNLFCSFVFFLITFFVVEFIS